MDNKDNKETIPVVVYVAQGLMEANVIKSRLESEGIPAMLQYESVGMVFALTADTLGQVRVMVPQPLEETARAILEEALEESDEDDEDDEEEDEDDEDDEDEEEDEEEDGDDEDGDDTAIR